MPAAPSVAPPTATPSQTVNIVDTGPPKPPPAPTSTIRVSQMPTSTAPTVPPKPGSAKDRLFSKLREKATTPGAPPDDSPTPTDAPTEVTPDEGGEPTTPPSSTDAPATTGEPTKPDKKVSPWKLIDQYKSRVSDLEKQVADVKTSTLPKEERDRYITQLDQITKRNQVLEEEMRFINYEKSEEFQQKYEVPYNQQWKRAMSDLSEITVKDPLTGEERPAKAEDMLDLVTAPLGKARQKADEMFGPFANDAMAHRKAIREIWDAKEQARQEARTKGAERDKLRSETWNKTTTEAKQVIKETWDKANQVIVTDPKIGKYFTPVEGDQEINQRLAKGTELVDRAFAENPLDPNLTPEQRAQVVKRHAAVRNRAIAFGRMMVEVTRLEKKLAEMTKELEAYKGSEPATGGAPSVERPAGSPKGMDRLREGLRKIAVAR